MKTLKRFYEAVGGNYTEVASRLISDRLIRKFLLKFPDDSSYAVLCVSIEHEDYEEAFRAAHTLKGVCLNLGLSNLARSAIALTEQLRSVGSPIDPIKLNNLMSEIKKEYVSVIKAIHGLK